jgi:hypothetical protein
LRRGGHRKPACSRFPPRRCCADRSEEAKRFYPEGMPTTEGEYVINVRDVVDVVGDPGFAEEAGQPSIIALLRNLAVGDYALMPDHEKIWQ